MTSKTKLSRESLFKLLAVLLPFILLGGTEWALRAGGYGYDPRLFITDQTGTYYRLNPDVSKKYFTVEENATVGNTDLFSVKKSPATVRLFVLGASSSLGFPYMHNGAFPRLLKYKLQMAYPGISFEVVNLSLTAVNSHTLYDFSRQLVRYEPDAVLIYAGHNEYYGALGVASSSRLGRRPGWVRVCLKLREWKLGQLAFHLAARLRGTDKRLTDYNLTLMERMAREQAILYESEIYRQGIRQFDRNVGDLLHLWQEEKIPVYIGTLVSCERGLPPLAGRTRSLPAADRSIAGGQSVPGETTGEATGETIPESDADPLLLSAREANRWYARGEKAYAEGKYAEAKACYIQAKESDAIRFRAPEEINRLIRSYARRMENVYLADVCHTFEAYAEGGILDSTLLLEHVHPTLTGQKLICETFYRSLEESGWVKNLRSVIESASDQASAFRSATLSPACPVGWADYPLLAFDSVYGAVSILLLKELWPFNQPLPPADSTQERSYEEQLAGACAVRQLSWYEAMQRLYAWAERQKDFSLALRVMESLCLEFPEESSYWRQAGKLCLRQGEDRKACFYFAKRYAAWPSGEAAADLAIAWLKQDRPEIALPYLAVAVNDRHSRVDFSPLKQVVEEIVALKQRLSEHPADAGLQAAIAAAYRKIGNAGVAGHYERAISASHTQSLHGNTL